MCSVIQQITWLLLTHRPAVLYRELVSGSVFIELIMLFGSKEQHSGTSDLQYTDQQPACFSCLNALIEINLWMFDLFLSPTDPLPGRLFFLFSAWTDWHHITHSHVSFTKSPQSYRGADKRSLMSEKCPGWGHQISWILSIFLSFSCKLILQQLSFSGKTVFPKNY